MSRQVRVYAMVLIVTTVPLRAARAATFSEHDATLDLSSAHYRITFDAHSGRLLAAEDRAGGGELVWGEEALWRVERRKAAPVSAASYGGKDATRRFRHTWNERDNTLTFSYTANDLDVTIVCRADAHEVDYTATLSPHSDTVLRYEFPAGLRFDARMLETFYFPHRIGLGFTRQFFMENNGRWQRAKLGPRGFEYVTGGRCEMRPVEDDRVGLTVTPTGKQWLPAWYNKEATRWSVLANRCTARGAYDLCLLDSPHGAYLTGHRLGGWGWLFRLGGFVHDSDYRPQFASVVATLYRLYDRPRGVNETAEVRIPDECAGKAPTGWARRPSRIGVLGFDGPREPGQRVNGGWATWVRDLSHLPWMKERGLEVVAIRSLPDLMSALDDARDFFLIVNPVGETFPAASPGDWEQTLSRLRHYVRNGGVWWEVGGGYSFYTPLVAERDLQFHAGASPLFSDFAHVDSQRGSCSVYGIQDADAVFVCPEMRVQGGGPNGRRYGRFEHAYLTHVPQGNQWQSPTLRMSFGTPMRAALATYGKANGYDRPLSEKLSSRTLDRLKSSVLLKLQNMSISQQIATLEHLPGPMLVHVLDYLRGGFDKQYPDHLPPNPAAGTPEQLKTLIVRCREEGHLFMPYTNPTWWCTEPKSLTFLEHGDAPLSRDLDGNVIAEAYGSTPSNRGFSVCAFHPAVRQANDHTRAQFVHDYPVDLLFEDQVGARRFRYDLNPAAPSGYAYLHGIHTIARRNCRDVPLATEEGHDRIINYETMFCGLSWPWLPNEARRSRVLYNHLWPEDAFRVEPLALYLAHDKVLFTHHDLGGFVLDRNDMVHSLAFGYGMSFVLSRNPAGDEETLEWLDCLSRIQRSVSARCAGQPLTAFTYLERHVVHARYGDVDLVANLAAQPYRINDETTIAPRGYRAVAPGLEAGIFTRYDGKDRSPDGWWLIRELGGGSAWTRVGDRVRP